MFPSYTVQMYVVLLINETDFELYVIVVAWGICIHVDVVIQRFIT